MNVLALTVNAKLFAKLHSNLYLVKAFVKSTFSYVHFKVHLSYELQFNHRILRRCVQTVKKRTACVGCYNNTRESNSKALKNDQQLVPIKTPTCPTTTAATATAAKHQI